MDSPGALIEAVAEAIRSADCDPADYESVAIAALAAVHLETVRLSFLIDSIEENYVVIVTRDPESGEDTPMPFREGDVLNINVRPRPLTA